jgi:lipoprotein NlpI
MHCWTVVLSLVLVLTLARPASGGEDSAKELLARAQVALDKGRTEQAVDLAGKAIDREPKNPAGYYFRGLARDKARQFEGAIADFDKAILLEPKAAEAYQGRGTVQFKLGHIKASLADFDKYLELRPDRRPGHWQRGISCYYAGRYADGQKQFEGYQSVDANDVENVVWRYLCQAKQVGTRKARADLLPIGKDRRVPLMEVYALFKGELKPADVLKTARKGNPTPEQLKERLFYAHLYLGLYYESDGDAKAALEHLSQAADEHIIGHYMWDVARVHRDLLRKQKYKRGTSR